LAPPQRHAMPEEPGDQSVRRLSGGPLWVGDLAGDARR
jgi:hypothetical protein